MSWTLLKQAELESMYADVYLYQFSYKGPLGGLMSIPIIAGEKRYIKKLKHNL